MSLLSKLVNKKNRVQRVGRGPGSGRGKTSSRGHKGYGSRGGFRRRYGYEGGQYRLFAKLPTRGFTRGRFAKAMLSLNLSQIDAYFNDGEVVCFETLRKKGLAPRKLPGGIKILGNGELTKKVSIEANKYSKTAIQKLEKKKVSYKTLQPLIPA